MNFKQTTTIKKKCNDKTFMNFIVLVCKCIDVHVVRKARQLDKTEIDRNEKK